MAKTKAAQTATAAAAATTATVTQAAPQPSAIVPRRGIVAGRRPHAYPDLDYRVISAALGIHPTHLGRVINGRSRPSIQMAEKLAAYMGWTLDQVNAFYKPSGRSGVKVATKKKPKESKPHAASRNHSSSVSISVSKRAKPKRG